MVSTDTSRTLFSWRSKGSRFSKWTLVKMEVVMKSMHAKILSDYCTPVSQVGRELLNICQTEFWNVYGFRKEKLQLIYNQDPFTVIENKQVQTSSSLFHV